MRLFVTGPTGSGKTTLAARLSARAALPLHSLDDIHWVRHPNDDRRRGPEERAAMLEEVVKQDGWVIEGVQFKWADIALARADSIIVLDLPRWRNRFRILRRFVGRRCSPLPNARGTVAALREELRWSADYYGHEREMLFGKLERWRDKVLIARDARSQRDAIAAVMGGKPRSAPDGDDQEP